LTQVKEECKYNGKNAYFFIRRLEYNENNQLYIADSLEMLLGRLNIIRDLYPVLASEVAWVEIDENYKNDAVAIHCYFYPDSEFRKDNKGVRSTIFQGYSEPTEFFNPNYSEYVLPDKQDFRRTLYWNPNVETDSKGKASVFFYNNSTCKEVGVSAETVTESGALGWYGK